MVIEDILKDIQMRGFSIQENFLSDQFLTDLKKDVIKAYHNNSFKKAGVGKAATIKSNIRGDEIYWLDKEKLTSSQQEIWDFLETFKVSLNKNFFLNIDGFEVHATVYPKNTFYKKHIDQLKQIETVVGSKLRKVSFILYLNENWKESDGGQLRLFDGNGREMVSVLPKKGRCVFFLSDEFPHEVLETKRMRISITGWLYEAW